MPRDSRRECLSKCLSVSEAAKLVNKSEITLKQRCEDGRFPAGSVRKAGRNWLIHYTALVEAYGEPVVSLESIVKDSFK